METLLEIFLPPLSKLQNAVVLEGLEMKVIFGEAGLRCAQMVIRMYSGVLMAIYIVAKLIQSLFVVHNRQLALY